MSKTRKIFFILLLAFFVFNLATISDYGITWDEPAQHHVGKVAKDYLSGKTDKLEFQREDLIFYGPFFEILNQYFGGWMMDIFGIGYANAFHILILIASAIGIFFLFKLASLLFGERVALISSVLLMLYPRFVAHSHYNPKDIPLFAFFTATLYFLHRAFIESKEYPSTSLDFARDKSLRVSATDSSMNLRSCFSAKADKKSVWFAGIFLGFGLATRADIILVLPVFFIPYLAYLIAEKRICSDVIKKDAFLLVNMTSTALATVFIFWPTLWQNPKIFFESFGYFLNHGWDNSVFYLGQFYKAKELPWHYAPLYLAIATPVAMLVLIGFGLFNLAKKIRADIFSVLLILTWAFLRIFFAMIPNAARYDGIRHFLMVVPAFMVIGALGFDFILEKSKKIGAVIGVLILISLIVEFGRIYPFGDSYFNEITRISAPKPLENYFETEYWGASYKQGVDWINKNADLNSKICVPMADHLLQFYKIRQDIKIVCAGDSNYIMIMQRPSFLPPDFKSFIENRKSDIVFTINRFNYNLLTILKIPPK